MSDPRRVRVVLHLDPSAEPLAGEVEADDRGSRPFAGWMELASAIEALAEAHGAAGDGHRQRTS